MGITTRTMTAAVVLALPFCTCSNSQPHSRCSSYLIHPLGKVLLLGCSIMSHPKQTWLFPGVGWHGGLWAHWFCMIEGIWLQGTIVIWLEASGRGFSFWSTPFFERTWKMWNKISTKIMSTFRSNCGKTDISCARRLFFWEKLSYWSDVETLVRVCKSWSSISTSWVRHIGF